MHLQDEPSLHRLRHRNQQNSSSTALAHQQQLRGLKATAASLPATSGIRIYSLLHRCSATFFFRYMNIIFRYFTDYSVFHHAVGNNGRVFADIAHHAHGAKEKSNSSVPPGYTDDLTQRTPITSLRALRNFRETSLNHQSS